MRNADGVRNLRKIIDDEQNLFIIVSAMGKTTNALEKVFEGVQKGDKDLALENVAALREYHAGIINDLWHGPKRLEKVDALICGGIGGGAQMALSDVGIRLYGGVSGNADAAAEALAAGELDFNPNVRCDHHDHHGEGHSCGSHGCDHHSCG